MWTLSKVLCRNQESNLGPLYLESSALSTEPFLAGSFLAYVSCGHYGLTSLNQPHLSIWWGATCTHHWTTVLNCTVGKFSHYHPRHQFQFVYTCPLPLRFYYHVTSGGYSHIESSAQYTGHSARVSTAYPSPPCLLAKTSPGPVSVFLASLPEH